MKDTYRGWLTRRGLKQSSVSTYISDAKQIEKRFGDLDDLYDADGLEGVLRELQYSKDDERRNRPAPSGLQIDGNVYKSIAGYRTAVKLYREFLEGSSRASLSSSSDPWDGYLREAQRWFDTGNLDRDESYKSELAQAVSEARDAVLADADDWQRVVTAAIGHKKNNLINPRSYTQGSDSNQAKIARWNTEM